MTPHDAQAIGLWACMILVLICAAVVIVPAGIVLGWFA
jgi:hypothetical protein